MTIIRAAGGLLWREDGSERRVALIHRHRREDWSLPKGKLDPGESWEQAALREVKEETGCEARIASFAGVAHYLARRTPKIVLYWNMTLVREGELEATDEVDEVAWLTPREALKRLDHESDREILRETMHLSSPAEAVDSSDSAPSAPSLTWVAVSVLGAAAALGLWLAPAGAGWLALVAAACGALAGGVSGWLQARRP